MPNQEEFFPSNQVVCLPTSEISVSDVTEKLRFHLSAKLRDLLALF